MWRKYSTDDKRLSPYGGGLDYTASLGLLVTRTVLESQTVSQTSVGNSVVMSLHLPGHNNSAQNIPPHSTTHSICSTVHF